MNFTLCVTRVMWPIVIINQEYTKGEIPFYKFTLFFMNLDGV